MKTINRYHNVRSFITLKTNTMKTDANLQSFFLQNIIFGKKNLSV